MLNWYALRSKPHQEDIVQSALRARGIETYLPVWRPPEARTGRRVVRPYFPCYLFARADLEVTGVSGLQYTPGVRQVVLRGDRPASVDGQVIDELRQRLVELEASLMDQRGHVLHHGDRVIIRAGLFEGYEAIFDRRLSSGERVRVLVDFLQHRTPCELDAAWVEKRVP